MNDKHDRENAGISHTIHQLQIGQRGIQLHQRNHTFQPGQLPLTIAWHRPTHVQVDGPDGSHRLPIRDTTRLAQLAILAGAIMIIGIIRPKRKQK